MELISLLIPAVIRHYLHWPLANVKSEGAAAALAFARAKTAQAFAVLGALSHGRTHFDKHDVFTFET